LIDTTCDRIRKLADNADGLDDGRRERRGRVDRELELALLAIVARELLEEEGGADLIDGGIRRSAKS
jgi:hypothetical protein